jgi:hypothetical protein
MNDWDDYGEGPFAGSEPPALARITYEAHWPDGGSITGVAVYTAPNSPGRDDDQEAMQRTLDEIRALMETER